MRSRTRETTKRTELEKAEAALEQERRGVVELERGLEQAIAQRDELAENVDAYRANKATIDDVREELGRRRRLVARRETDLAEAARQLEHARWEDTRDDLEQAYARNGKTSGAVAQTLETLDAQIRELEQSRAKVEELEAKFSALVPSDVDDPAFPQNCDEPAWPESKTLVEFVQSGPRRPATTLASKLAEQRRQHEASERAEVAQSVRDYLRDGMTVRLKSLRPELHPLVDGMARRYASEEIARLEASRDHPDVLDPHGVERQIARTREALERRVEQIPELLGAEVETTA